MGRLFFNIWPYTPLKLCTLAFFAKIGSKYCLILNKAFEKLPKNIRSLSQNGEISPILVTLVVVKWVSMLAFYFDVTSSNPAEAYIFSVKIVAEKNKNKQ